MRAIGLRGLLVAMLALPLGVSGAAGQAGPVDLGEPVTYLDDTGTEQGTVTVTQVVDPFDGFLEGYPPQAGSRFVLVVLAFEGTGDEGIQAYPPNIYLHLADGRTYAPTTVYVPDDFSEADLTIQDVGPGSLVSGFVGYAVPEDAVVDGVLVSYSGTLLIPADMGMPRPPIETPVTMTDPDGAAVEATVRSILDPYRRFDKDRPPAEGGRFVLISASLENTGEGPFRIERNGFLLRDVNGKLWGLTEIAHARKPKQKDIDTTDLGRGNRLNGLLPFQVPEDIELEGLYYQGDGGFYRLAAFSDPGTAPTTAAKPTCEEMMGYWEGVNPLFQRLVALPPFQDQAQPMDEAASVEMLDEIRSIREDLQALEVPASLGQVHTRMVGALLLYERSAEDQVTAARDGDPEALRVSGAAFDAAQIASQDAFGALDELGFDDCEQS
jgi:hypothetical protein